MKKIALFLTVLAVSSFAEERHMAAEVGEKMDHAAAKAMWNRADALFSSSLFNNTFPQAPGIVSVLGWGNNYQIDFLGQNIPAGTSVGGEMIDPSGESISLQTYYFGQAVSGEIEFQLMNGAFPTGWPAGITKFRMLVMNASGKVTEADAYVAVNSCCNVETAPQVISIVPSTDGSKLTITGQFSKAPMVGVNGTLTKITSGTSTGSAATGTLKGTIVIPAPVSLNDGNGVLTLCDAGNCSQTFFHVPAPPSGGKG